MQAAIFDLDAAFAGANVDTLWWRFLRGLGEIDDAQVERCDHVARQYGAGTVVPEDYALAQAALLAGRELTQLAPLLARFVAEVARPHLPAAFRELLQRHRAEGDTLLLTSATSRVLAEALARELGIGTVLGTELVWFGGRCTGMLSGHANMRTHKLDRVRQWLLAHGQGDAVLRRATFYSSSINDLALLSAVGRPVVVDPDPRLAATALRKGWRVLQLHRTPVQQQGAQAALA
ncbi:MAG TPA: HAD-IB family phosphatase [Rubrivivax sp.]|nr:HAD-IB family phosphatase [Burkholderiales bacterium]HNU10707.1 HAD-IB family phosphatase [Rubrivivax sp.]